MCSAGKLICNDFIISVQQMHLLDRYNKIYKMQGTYIKITCDESGKYIFDNFPLNSYFPHNLFTYKVQGLFSA
jgi:hypothetical protein